MKAIILAAGRGSRINHITKYKPKALIKFKKKNPSSKSNTNF